MSNPIFSIYKQGENRVTSTFLAVLENINNHLTEDIFEGLTDESDISLLSFENQHSAKDSVPDGVIKGSTSIWIETKTERDSIDKEQLENHLEALEDEQSANTRLIVLTPDGEEPPEIPSHNQRLVWSNFDSLINTINNILDRDAGTAESSMHIPTERESFLLREFVRFIYDEELESGKDDRVLVVAARKAWPEFQEFGLYFCQPNRTFKPCSHMAFYTDGEIKPKVPKIRDTVESLSLKEEAIRGGTDLNDAQREELLEFCEQANKNSSDRYGDTVKVIFFSSVKELDRPIQNDKTATNSDRGVAFVQGHRYVSLDKLIQNPEKTSELE